MEINPTTICQLVNFKFHFIIYFWTNCWYTSTFTTQMQFCVSQLTRVGTRLNTDVSNNRKVICVSQSLIWTAERSSKEIDDKNWQSAAAAVNNKLLQLTEIFGRLHITSQTTQVDAITGSSITNRLHQVEQLVYKTDTVHSHSVGCYNQW